ncbi:putative ATPase [Sediminihabitans luteus]|uniref:Putative ATPase n=1 Tax=Sediminihabitans luteus TaxID=1138585 RepID=A0A2M9CR65_9CELL|nr:BTAD domain-containing putative transcriptional regulator [Sediminihabitans luteus]PJJ74430.1 putative ATPase [Sediminihabitans luteus]GIJ00203.1 SARP family transcriptional regulator [Sediminihabitans luteus]
MTDDGARPAPAVAVLGPVAVRTPAGLVPVPGERSRALLVALALRDGGTVGVGALVDDLWPDARPDDPRAALQNVVARVRRVAPCVRTVAGGYALAGGSDLALARQGRADAGRALDLDDPGAALVSAETALALWRGEPGGDLGGELGAELARAAGHLHGALRRTRVRALVALGRAPEAVAEADALSAAVPSDEDAALDAMRAHAAAGRTGDALRVFARLREALADELGTDPGPAARAEHARLLAADDVPAPAASTRGRVVGVRAAPNALVGRDTDLAGVTTELGRGRLVTVLGPGGLGKTRLVQAVAARESAHRPLVVVVELASVRADADVEHAVAAALGVRETAATTRIGDQIPRVDLHGRVLAALDVPGTLVVLDNCEHVVDGVARWVDDVLALTPASVLTTSRAPLGLGAEVVHPLPPLRSTDGTGPGPAVELFEQRARAARPDVELPRDVVRRLCDRLDGLPLAIELAAARVRSLSVVEVERRLATRFALLTSVDRAAPARHRTLEAVIDWSWNLLDDAERTALRRLAALPDAFGLDTACALDLGAHDLGAHDHGGQADELAVLAVLDGLVAQSMLTVQDGEAAVGTRYRMLETVREFGLLRLADAGEQQAVRDAAEAWAAHLAESLLADFWGPRQLAALRRVHVERDNLGQALRWAIADERPDAAVRVYALLARYWLMRSAVGEMAEVALDVTDALAGTTLTGADAAWSVWALMVGGSPLGAVMDASRSARAHARLRGLLRRDRAEAVLTPAGRVYARFVEAATSEPTDFAGAVGVLRSGDGWSLAMVADLLASQLAENEGRIADAVELARRARTVATDHADAWGAAAAAQSLAELHAQHDEPAQALHWSATARAGLSAFDAAPFLLQLEAVDAGALTALGRLDEAAALCERMVATPDGAPTEAAGRSADESMYSPADRRTAGLVGLAQVAFARGDAAAALALSQRAIDEVRAQRERGGFQARILHCASRLAIAVLSPGVTAPGVAALGVSAPGATASGVTASGATVPGVSAPGVLSPGVSAPGATSSHEREAWARDLRARTRAVLRAGRGFTDRPVLGAAALVLGTYLWSSPGIGRVDDGLELLGIAEVLTSREDWLAVRRERHRAAALAATSADAVRAGLGRARELPDPVARVRELLETGPWGPAA